MTLRARFVYSISASPTVRLDLVAAPWRLQKSSRFDPPPAKRARVSTLLTDGATYPASAYEDRVLELHLLMENASTDDAAAAIQVLARELDRPMGNIFEYRLPDQTHSVFFRTVRLAMESVDIVTEGRDQFVSAPVIAEPFAYGLREDPVVDAAVSADPAAGSNGCFVDVTGVKGDVESPALIKWPESAYLITTQTVMASRRRGAPSAAPFLFQAEAMTQGTDTTVQANDTAFSGTGSNYSRCTFATNATMQTRISTADLGTPSVDLRGTYRVFLRYRKNTAGDAINLRLRWGGTSSAASVTNDSFAAPDVSVLTIADLGLVTIPFGFDPVYNFRSGVELAVDDFFWLVVQAERTSGSGTLDLDYLVLVPADDRLGIVEWTDRQSVQYWWLDAHDTSAQGRKFDVTEQITPVAAPKIAGGFPMLSPDQTNRIYMLHEVAAGNTHSITVTPTVSVSYYPLYLSVRPAST